MVGHFQFKQLGSSYLLTNDFGCHCFLTPQQFHSLLRDKQPGDADKQQELTEKGFLYEGGREAYIQQHMSRLRGMRSYLFQGTSLHIFVVTTHCNGSCIYCQAQSHLTGKRMMMDAKTARKAVDIALQSPASELSFEFQGGEPLMNMDIIREIVTYTESLHPQKHITFNIVSNLTLLDADKLDFIREHQISLSTSLDGPREIHDRNRPFLSGEGMFDAVSRQICWLHEQSVPVGAIETTTRYTLAQPEALADAYCEMGLHSLFIRPLTPLGRAAEQWETIGYTPAEFTEFYRRCILAILEKNRFGYAMYEGHARLFLRKILTQYADNYMDLRSPCGAAVGQMAYYPDGNIYTCDEGRMLAEMGDPTFRLGNVYTDDYAALIGNPVSRAACLASVTESQPLCGDCVYQPYCGVCPVVSHALQHDLTSHSFYRCNIYQGMLDTLFTLLEDTSNLELFQEWL